MAPIVAISNPCLSILTAPPFPSSPLTVPVGLGISLIRNGTLELTVTPSGVVPDAVIVTSLPDPGLITYLLPLTLVKPAAEAVTLSADRPGIAIVIGFSTPR